MEGAYGEGKRQGVYAKVAEEPSEYLALTPSQLEKKIKTMEQQMYKHAQNMEFEEAAKIRDEIRRIQDSVLV